MKGVIVKHPNGLEIPFKGLGVSSIQASYTGDIALYFGLNASRIEYQCRLLRCELVSDNVANEVNHSSHIGIELLCSLLGRIIERCFLFEDGQLQFTFEDNIILTIPPDPDVEHWELDRLEAQPQFTCGSSPGGGYDMVNWYFKVVPSPSQS
jgi:hypothetical protein